MKRSALFKETLSIFAIATIIASTGTAFGAVIDRVRCKVSTSTVVGEPNQVQINVKIDEAFADTPIDVQVFRSQPGTLPVHSATHTWVDIVPFIIDETVSVTWDSAPDPLITPVDPELLIDSDFVQADDEITAVAIDASGIAGIVSTLSAVCKEKAGGIFRQDTKPCKQKDFDRGRCSPVTEP